MQYTVVPIKDLQRRETSVPDKVESGSNADRYVQNLSRQLHSLVANGGQNLSLAQLEEDMYGIQASTATKKLSAELSNIELALSHLLQHLEEGDSFVSFDVWDSLHKVLTSEPEGESPIAGVRRMRLPLKFTQARFEFKVGADSVIGFQAAQVPDALLDIAQQLKGMDPYSYALHLAGYVTYLQPYWRGSEVLAILLMNGILLENGCEANILLPQFSGQYQQRLHALLTQGDLSGYVKYLDMSYMMHTWSI